MEPQFIISITVGVAAFVVGFVGRWYLFFAFALVFASILAGHFAYPDRSTQDALWLIGAMFALMIDTAAIAFGLLTGWLCRRLVLHHRAKQNAGTADPSD